MGKKSENKPQVAKKAKETPHDSNKRGNGKIQKKTKTTTPSTSNQSKVKRVGRKAAANPKKNVTKSKQVKKTTPVPKPKAVRKSKKQDDMELDEKPGDSDDVKTKGTKRKTSTVSKKSKATVAKKQTPLKKQKGNKHTEKTESEDGSDSDDDDNDDEEDDENENENEDTSSTTTEGKERKKRKTKPGKKIKQLWNIKNNTGKVNYVKKTHFEAIIKLVLEARQNSGIDADILKSVLEKAGEDSDENEDGEKKNFIVDKKAKSEILSRMYNGFSLLLEKSDTIKKHRMTKKSGKRLNEKDIMKVLEIDDHEFSYFDPAKTIERFDGETLELYMEFLISLIAGRGDMIKVNDDNDDNDDEMHDSTFAVIDDGQIASDHFAIQFAANGELNNKLFDYQPDKKRVDMTKNLFKKPVKREPKTEGEKSKTKKKGKIDPTIKTLAKQEEEDTESSDTDFDEENFNEEGDNSAMSSVSESSDNDEQNQGEGEESESGVNKTSDESQSEGTPVKKSKGDNNQKRAEETDDQKKTKIQHNTLH